MVGFFLITFRELLYIGIHLFIHCSITCNLRDACFCFFVILNQLVADLLWGSGTFNNKFWLFVQFYTCLFRLVS
ncbi:hypothetical protein QVD17_17273 [Tagetes erecta]|uniref:Uncharacterized protein n=1 Tax=Tagetes erecta TaxID=13708 RepID=A0AAD8KTK6_TARER|nr:hypothetical protein QVD17_17273 [Tagetes erecta]